MNKWVKAYLMNDDFTLNYKYQKEQRRIIIIKTMHKVHSSNIFDY